MAIKAVIDTNIWVSALINPFGFPALLRQAFADGLFTAVISTPMLDELKDVMGRTRIRKKYHISEEDILTLCLLIEDLADDTVLFDSVAVCRDKDDDQVIETAIRGGAQYLVSRDDDLKFAPEVSAFLSGHGVTVISLQKFIALINKA